MKVILLTLLISLVAVMGVSAEEKIAAEETSPVAEQVDLEEGAKLYHAARDKERREDRRQEKQKKKRQYTTHNREHRLEGTDQAKRNRARPSSRTRDFHTH